MTNLSCLQIKSLRTVEEASMKLADNLISSKNMIMALPLYRDYSKFPDLQFPKAGDHIAFKVMLMLSTVGLLNIYFSP